MKTSQIWNIFRKDVRHHWIEIGVSLALLAGFVSAEIRDWSELGARATGLAAAMFGIFPSIAVPLTPVSWMYLIVRIVQDESLAGDRQFWVTRPYDWKQLLLAKVLFVLIFINVPFFLAQTFLVAKAGFPPMHYLSGLLWLQLMWMFVLFVPTAALASATRNLGHLLLALLFIALFAIGSSTLSNVIPSSSFSGGVNMTLILVAALAVILLQYSLRRTTQSRWIIATLGITQTLVMVATPYRTLIARAYPPAGADFPQLSLQPPPQEVHYELRERIPLPITFTISGLPQDSFVELNGVILTLKNSSGQHWDSGWQPRGRTFFPGEGSLISDLEITQDVLDKLKSSPMSADVLLALTLYHDSNQRQFVVPHGEFPFPDLGFCSTTPGPISALSCRIPLRRPTFLMVTSDVASSTCPLAKDQVAPSPGQIVRAYVRGSSSIPADPGLSPIQMDGISFWMASSSRMSGICPGTPLTLSNPVDAGHRRIEVHVDSFWFAAYLQALNKNKASLTPGSGSGFMLSF